MELRIKHTVGLVYDATAATSYLEARLTPVSDGRQSVRNPHLDVDPQPWSTTYTDYWGARVAAFEVRQPHESVTVTATSSVRTTAVPASGATLSWDELAAPRVADELSEFLVVGGSLPPADLGLRATKLVAEGALPGEVALEVCQGAQVADALAALREVGVPCRYVSGYVLGRSEPHEWLEWWDGSWQAFDPAAGEAPGEGHVTRAVGRSAADVRSLRGVATGAAVVSRIDTVQMTQL